MMIFNCFIFSVIIAIALSAKLPSFFKKCSKSDPNLGKCVVKSGMDGLQEFIKGDPAIRVVPLNPLNVPEMFIDVDGNLKINLTRATINGLGDSNITDITWDFDKKRMDMTFKIPNANLISTYDIAGRILILPINGVGPANVTYINGTFQYSIDFEIQAKNNKNFVKITKNSLKYTTDRAYFQLDELFGGDPVLGLEMNKFLNENWKEVNKEIGVRVGDALGEVITTILKGFFSKLPLEELFDP